MLRAAIVASLLPIGWLSEAAAESTTALREAASDLRSFWVWLHDKIVSWQRSLFRLMPLRRRRLSDGTYIIARKRIQVDQATKILLVTLLLLFATSAHAQEFKVMTVGEDAYVFDYDFSGQKIRVYAGGGEPGTDWQETWSHVLFIVGDICIEVGCQGGFDGIGISSDFIQRNAFATIYEGGRWLVVDPSFPYQQRILVMAHEIGHHICGHTKEIMSGDPWGKELEADRFAGMVVRRLEGGTVPSQLGIRQAIDAAIDTLSAQGTATHPPRDMRVAAIVQGYYSGSPCVGRLGAVTPPSDTGDSGGPSLWNHNGSIVSLAANGAQRRFYYEVPRYNIAALGVMKGTLLFEGRKDGNQYSGKAYIFSRVCGPIAYYVTGDVSADQRQVTLYGKAPRLGSGCEIVGYRDDVLLFRFERTAGK